MASIVTDVDRTGVVVEAGGTERRIAARTKIWAAGVQASPLARMLAEAIGAECRSRRAHHRASRLHAARPPRGVRDRRHDVPGRPPGVAEVAMQQGIHASHTIKRRLRGKEGKPFRYRDLGSMATISRFRAVVSFKGIRLSGFVGWLAWLFVHLTFLTGFKNRLATIPTLGGHLHRQQPSPADDHHAAGDRPGRDRGGRGPAFLLSLTSDDEPQDPGGRAAQVIGSRRVDGFEALTLSSRGRRDRGCLRPRGRDGGLFVAPSWGGAARPAGRPGPIRRRALDHGHPAAPPLGEPARRADASRWPDGRSTSGHTPSCTRLGPKGLPIHGLLAAAAGWSVDRHEDTPEGRTSWPASTSPLTRT